MAVLLLWSYAAFLEAANGRKALVAPVLFGFAFGCTIPIKPVLLPLGIALLLLQLRRTNHTGQIRYRDFSINVASMVLPSVVALAWLRAKGTLHLFLAPGLPLIRLHASLGDRPVGYLIAHSTSPFDALCVFWVLLLLIDRPALTFERVAILVGVLATFAGYFIQSKGYPYQRYPLLALLLLLIAVDSEQALRRSNALRKGAAVACISIGCILALIFARRTISFSPAAPFQAALELELEALAPLRDLDRNVQCMDTFGGCVGTLYGMRLTQSTGFIYDCYLFTGDSQERERYRSSFSRTFLAAEPKIVILTNQFCFGDVRGFGRLRLWPEFGSYISANYDLRSEWSAPALQHWWARKEPPPEFRIYVRRFRSR